MRAWVRDHGLLLATSMIVVSLRVLGRGSGSRLAVRSVVSCGTGEDESAAVPMTLGSHQHRGRTSRSYLRTTNDALMFADSKNDGSLRLTV